jgi:group I intron endonuclease
MIIKIKNENLFNIRRDIGVYLIRCIPENKIYIGSTNQSFRARFSNHCKFLKSGNLSNKELQTDFNKYRESNFEFEILGAYPENLTVQYEQFFINKLNPYYNVAKACNKSLTNNGKKFSDEHKEKIRQKSKLYKHDSKTLEILTKINKENSTIYKLTNINTNTIFEKFIKIIK